MPAACIFTLRPTAPITVPANLSRATHAAVLALVANTNPELATQLHISNQLKPFTVSNIQGLEPHGQQANVSPERRYGLRVTMLSKELEALGNTWQSAAITELILDHTTWQVERLTKRDHPWAGHVSYEELLAQAMQRTGHTPPRWTLEFASPVTFRHHARNLPLPTPELVFGSLLDRWNATSPLPLPDELRRFVADQLMISCFALRSSMEPTKNGALQIGALGRCTYTTTSRDRYWLTCIETLAHFAFYSGVGSGTARGFGQTRLIDRSNPSN